MSYYSLLAHSITPSSLMIIASIRGNCLALSVSCYIAVLHRSIPASCFSVADLSNKLIGFFGKKITTIRHELDSNPKQGIHLFNEVTVAATRLHRFSCPSYSTLLKIVHPLASKSNELDPVPSRIRPWLS